MPLLQKLKWLWVVLLFLPVILTTKIQFSCYPLITNGELPPVCYQQPNISKVITDSHTHGTVLYHIASTSSDKGVLRQLSSNSDMPRVDYDSQRLQVEILGNKNTPSDLSESIFKNLIDGKVPLSEELLKRLTRNSNTPDSILQFLISLNNDYLNSLISDRSQLSSETIALLFYVTQSSTSSYKYEILSGIASQENISVEMMKILLEKAKKFENSEDKDQLENRCSIYQGLAKNLTLTEKLGGKATFVNNRVKECKKKDHDDDCTSKTGRNIKWAVGTGIAVATGVLIVGSGGLLAPIALGAGVLTAGTVYVAGEFLSKCP